MVSRCECCRSASNTPDVIPYDRNNTLWAEFQQNFSKSFFSKIEITIYRLCYGVAIHRDWSDGDAYRDTYRQITARWKPHDFNLKQGHQSAAGSHDGFYDLLVKGAPTPTPHPPRCLSFRLADKMFPTSLVLISSCSENPSKLTCAQDPRPAPGWFIIAPPPPSPS